MLFDTSSVQFILKEGGHPVFEILTEEFKELRKNMEAIADTLNSIVYQKDHHATIYCDLCNGISAYVPPGKPVLQISQNDLYPVEIELSMEEFNVLYYCNDILNALSI